LTRLEEKEQTDSQYPACIASIEGSFLFDHFSMGESLSIMGFNRPGPRVINFVFVDKVEKALTLLLTSHAVVPKIILVSLKKNALSIIGTSFNIEANTFFSLTQGQKGSTKHYIYILADVESRLPIQP
jgi:hypothetical protein